MNPGRTFQILWLSLALLLNAGIALPADGNLRNNYRLGTGDTISITVFQEEDLSLQARISDTGVITYPFLGGIRVIGLTVAELEARITKGLKGDYLVNPRVRVSVINYREFFVNGEVKSPGSYPYAPGLTVRKAISIAGGFAERADKDKLYVLHEKDADGKPDKVTIDSLVRPGDILTVEQSFF